MWKGWKGIRLVRYVEGKIGNLTGNGEDEGK